MWGKVRRAVLEDAGCWSPITAASSSSPVLKAAFDQRDPDKGYGWTCDDGREELL